MKNRIFIFSLLSISLLSSGCGGGSSSDKTALSPLSLVSDNNISSEKQAIVIKPGPYKRGEFGTVDINSSYKVPKDAIFLDIRNDWEREDKWREKNGIWSNSKLASGSVGGAVYEYRDEKGQESRKVRSEFVDEVLKLSNNNIHQRLLLICNTSSRTKKAAKLLSDNNFTYVEHVNGGLSKWEKTGLEMATFKTIDIDGNYQVPQNSIFLDIRNSWERANQNYAKGSIEGAVYEYRDEKKVNPRKVRDEFASEVLALCENNRTKPIVLICNTASRTLKASKFLAENGFTNISHIKGGLENWKSSGLPIGE